MKKKLIEIDPSPPNDEDLPEERNILILKGVGPATFEKLASYGYDSLETVASANPKALAGKCDITEKFARGLIKEARDLLNLGEFRSIGEFFDVARKTFSPVQSGLNCLDNLLGGGFKQRRITELHGESGTGKTQISISAAILTAGRGRLVIYIDTKETFTEERFRQLTEGMDLDLNKTLAHILYFPVENTSQMLLTLESIKGMPRKKDIDLIVVDSATGFFRTEYMGRGQLSERQQTLNYFLSELKNTAKLTNSAVLITNQVMDRPDALFGDPIKPIGGHVVSHAVSYRIYLRKSKSKTFKGKIKTAPDIGEEEFNYKILSRGLEDAD